MKKLIAFYVICPFLLALSAHGAELSYELGFSPKGESLQVVLNGISSAKESILVAAYSFTSKPVSEALLDAHKRRVKVAVVADQKGNSGRYTAVNFLANQGVPVRLNGNYAIMHHKFMVIDGTAIQIGSFNYSSAAVDKNAENVLLLKDVSGIASRYAEEWNRLWDEGIDVKKNY
jgi:phosphatidylserine/phosphatidylglycerophosphate/cardiolipin synthase-like enzyme